MSARIIDMVGARGKRVWQGIEADDPPWARFDYDELLAMAEAMLAARTKRFPTLVQRGTMSAEAAQAELATFAAIVADWRWIVTGEGQPATLATIDARRAALDQSIRTIAEIARDERGFSDDLATRASHVIAMRWHLDPDRKTNACAALTHLARRGICPGETTRAV
jgi:hypothetical protein